MQKALLLLLLVTRLACVQAFCPLSVPNRLHYGLCSFTARSPTLLLQTFPSKGSWVLRAPFEVASLENARRNLGKGGQFGLTAGLDYGTALPNLDFIYFGGVLVSAIGGGLLLYQTYGGNLGLGTFLKTGPENKSWERTQAKAAAEQKVKMNEEQKGSFWASILPKLDFVEVYGQKKDEIDPQSELEALINKDGGGQVNQKLLELEIELNRAIDAQDYKKADEIQSQMKELTK